jgi:predicted nucleotidyltransferase
MNMAGGNPFPMERIHDFCRRWMVTELALFGSTAAGTAGPESDVDLLISFAPSARWSLLDHVRMTAELSDLVSRKVDLISRKALERNRNTLLRDAILSSARVIHAA